MLARSERPISPGHMDSDPMLLNCPNGTVNLRTGAVSAHSKEDRITCLCPTQFRPGVGSGLWESFLASTFGDDDELVRYVQRTLGYCLSGSTAEQIMPVWWGTGANGKSTLLNAFMSVLGLDCALKAPEGLLLVRNSTAHPTQLADLHRKRFVACVETPDEQSNSTGSRPVEPTNSENRNKKASLPGEGKEACERPRRDLNSKPPDRQGLNAGLIRFRSKRDAEV